MFSRAGSALLAVAATILLGLSLALSWWSGHPSIDGREPIRLKQVSVGLLGGEGCNTGGDGTCQPLELTGELIVQQYIEVGAIGVVAAGSLVLALLALVNSRRRRGVAKLVLASAGAAAIVAVALTLQGPTVEGHTISVPVGIGILSFGLGALASILAGVLALRPEPRLRLKPPAWQSPAARAQHGAPHQPHAPQAAPVDVLALLHEDALRPAQHGPDPRFGPHGGPPSAGGQPAPLFQAAPQLRPLYDATPHQGGTGGFVPSAAPPPLPARGPTPMPRAAASALTGMATPPPPVMASPVPGPSPVMASPVPGPSPVMASPVPGPGPSPMMAAMAQGPSPMAVGPPMSAMAPPPMSPAPMTPGASPLDHQAPRTKTLPPPVRGKPPSVAPPIVRPAVAGSVPPPPRTIPHPAGPPPRRDPAPAPIVRAQPTISSMAVPPPPNMAMPAPILAALLPSPRTETEPADIMIERPYGERLDSTGDHTDVGVSAIIDSGSQPFEVSTSDSYPFGGRAPNDSREGRAFSELGTDALDSQPFAESTTDGDGVRAPTNDDHVETHLRPKVGPTDLDLPVVPPLPSHAWPAAHEAPTVPAPHRPLEAPTVPATPRPAALAAAAAARATASAHPATPKPAAAAARPATPRPTPKPAPKVPLSTAPDSLPPPTAKQAMTTGPSPACPQCEAPMAWVEAHLRFYCKSCKMYF